MLIFEMRKSKSLSMPVLVEGINQDQLRFRLVVEIKGVDYGFTATQDGDNVRFIIPPLDNVVKTLEEGTYNARLEVSSIVEGDRGFFMQPWAEQVRIKKSANIAVVDVKDNSPVQEDKADKVKVKLAKIFSESDGVDEPEVVEVKEKVEKKNTKLSKFMEN